MFKHLYNSHKHETGLIICNGPSLKDVPFEFLNNFTSIGLNKIFMLPFTPHYLVAVNELVIAQSIHEFEKMSSESIIFLSNVAPALPFHYYPLRNHPIDAFSYCPWKWIYEGHTVTYVALQIAFFLGFETVLVVGLDHRYTFEGQPNELREMQGDDPNHFDPGYFEGQFWHNPDLAKADEAFRIAREAFEYDNRHIYNLTPDTGTDAFEKGGIAAWI